MTGTCEKCSGTGEWSFPRWPDKTYTCQRCMGTGDGFLGRSYAGIGSRETPMSICANMELIASMLAMRGLMLRSGQAKQPLKPQPGTSSADLAFESGCDKVNGRKIIRISTNTPAAMQHAAQFHPDWNACDDYARGKHARNSLIVMGDYLDDPARFIVCWTPDGGIVGGTGQALRIAATVGIPVFNLAIPGANNALWKYVAELMI